MHAPFPSFLSLQSVLKLVLLLMFSMQPWIMKGLLLARTFDIPLSFLVGFAVQDKGLNTASHYYHKKLQSWLHRKVAALHEQESWSIYCLSILAHVPLLQGSQERGMVNCSVISREFCMVSRLEHQQSN